MNETGTVRSLLEYLQFHNDNLLSNVESVVPRSATMNSFFKPLFRSKPPISAISVLFVMLSSSACVGQNRIGAGEIKDTYQKLCSSCHGKQLQGGSGSSLIDDEWKFGSSDAEIANVIRDGAIKLGMPAWKNALSDKEIRAMVIFIREQKSISQKAVVEQMLAPQKGIYNAAGEKFTLEVLTEGNDIFWSLAFMPDQSLLITQRNGNLLHYKGNKLQQIKGTPKVWRHGQGGLLEVYLHPQYSRNGWVYLSYSETKDGNSGMTAVSRGRIKDGKWVDEQKIFTSAKSLHTGAGTHFGSRFVFADGYLYFAIGDRGRKHQAQDLSKPNGKIHRIHDDGRIPSDNPFINKRNAIPSIWSYGHRNPQGLDLDPNTGLLWETEHGPRGGDEVNLIEKGKNYGWPEITYGMNYSGTPITEHTHKPGMEQPKHYWVPSIAVAGIDFYEGKAFKNWQGKLLVSGLASQELHLLDIKNKQVVSDTIVLKNAGRVRDVATGPDGNIYLLLNRSSSKLARLVPVN